MKIGIKKNRNQFGHKGGGNIYTHLIIENVDDVFIYNDILSNRNAEANTDILFGFKSQNFRQTLSDYMVHELPGSPVESRLLAMKLNYKETSTSLVDFCEMSDNIVSDKCKNILKHINTGEIIRINNVGGYCFVDDMDDYDELFEPTIEQIHSYIHFGNIKTNKYVINTDTVIIENGSNISDNFKSKLSKHFNEYDELTNFRNVIRTYNDKEVIELFVTSIKNGLKNICFETTGQDFNQIKKMKIILDTVTNLTNVKLNLYISTYNKNVLDYLKDYNIIKIKP